MTRSRKGPKSHSGQRALKERTDHHHDDYKLTMSVHPEKTIIHIQPVLHQFESPSEPPPVKDEPEPYILAIAIGIAVLIFILAILLLCCCCCGYCPLYEWRRRRRKKQREIEADIAWRRKSEQFTTPKFEYQPDGKLDPNVNGTVNGDIGKMKISGLESAPPPSNDETADLLPSTPTMSFLDHKNTAPPSMVASTDLQSYSNKSSEPETKMFNGGHRPSAVSQATTFSRPWHIEPIHSPTRLGETTWVDSCAVTSNSLHLLTGSTHGPPCIWDLQTGNLMSTLEGQDVASGSLTLAANDKVLLAMVQDSTNQSARMQIWDMTTTSRIHMTYPLFVSAIAPLHTRSQVVLAQFDPQTDANPTLVLWDVLANEEVCLIPFQHPNGMSTEGGLTFLQVSFDDRLVLTGFTNTQTLESCYMVFDLEANHREGILDPLVIPIDARLNCTVITGGQWEAASGTREGHIMVWNMMTGQLSRHLLTSSVTCTSDEDRSAHPHEITLLVNSYDGHLMVSGDANGIVHFWNGRSGRWKASVHVPLLSTIVISQDSQVVVTGSSSGAIHLWRSSNGQAVGQMSTALDIVSLVIPNDKSAIVVLGNKQNHHERGMLILRLTKADSKPNLASYL